MFQPWVILRIVCALSIGLSALSVAGATPAPASVPFAVTRIETARDLPGVILMGRSQGGSPISPIYSIDGGMIWHPLVSDTVATDMLAVTRRDDPLQPIRFVAVQGMTLYRTGDFGASWSTYTFPTEPACSSHASFDIVSVKVTELITSPADSRRLYATVGCTFVIDYDVFTTDTHYVVYTSSDAALTWTQVFDKRKIMAVKPSPKLANRVYVNYWGGFDDHCDMFESWYQSDDAGGTWKSQYISCYPSIIEISPENTYIYTMWGEEQEANWFMGFQRKVADTWDFVTLTNPCASQIDFQNGQIQMLTLPTEFHMLLSCPSAGIFYTNNSGSSWTKRSADLGQKMSQDRANPGRLLWAKEDGFWVSQDEGLTWTQLTGDYQHLHLFMPGVLKH